MKKLLLVCVLFFAALAMNAQSFVDLGLPSGTKWKTQNQQGFYTYDSAISSFGDRIPTMEQWEELQIECSWNWTGGGYLITGPNGNSITLPAAGYSRNGNVESSGVIGIYWAYEYADSYLAWNFWFNYNMIMVNDPIERTERLSVRLVQN